MFGTADTPRLIVHRGLKNLHAIFVDDQNNKVICSMATYDKELKGKMKNGGNIAASKILGEALALKAKEKGIKKIIFDRSGYLYHGRIREFAEALRKGGLEF